MRLVTFSTAAILAVILGALPAHADFFQITTRAGLGADDSIVWSNLGGDLTPLSSPASLTTQNGKSATLTGSSAFALFLGSTYNADFLSTDTVLSAFDLNAFNPLSTGIEIDFANPIFGIGAQVQANAFGPFTATLQAFGAGNAFLGSVQLNSSIAGNGDGSAPFLGGVSSHAIYSVVFSADQPGVAINDVSTASVPEPTSVVLLLSVMGLVARRFRRT